MLCFSWTVLISLSTSIYWSIMSNIIILRKCIFNHYGTSCRIFNHFELNIDPHHDQQWLTSWLTMVPIFVFEIQESTKIFLLVWIELNYRILSQNDFPPRATQHDIFIAMDKKYFGIVFSKCSEGLIKISQSDFCIYFSILLNWYAFTDAV